ncbi:MAG: tetratricopeptide repeat protein [Planctomycetota bacterium]
MRVRIPLLLFLLAIVLGLSAVIFFVHRLQVPRSAETLLQLARKAREVPDLPLACRHYDRYLELKPQEADIRSEFGICLLDAGQPDRAFLQLESARRLDPNAAGKRQLTKAAIVLGRFEYATQLISDELLPENPDDAELFWWRGGCFLKTRNSRGAEADFRKASAMAPENASYASELVTLLSKKDPRDPDEELSIIDRLVESSDRSATALIARAGWLIEEAERQQQDESPSLRQAAVNDLELAFESEPGSVEAIYLAIKSFESWGDPQSLRDQIELATTQSPDSSTPYLLAAELHLKTGSEGAAYDSLKRGIDRVGRDIALLFALAELELSRNNLEAVQQLLVEIRKGKPDDLRLTRLEARYLVRSSRWEEALNRIEDFKAGSDGSLQFPDLDLLLSECYRKTGDPTRAITLLRATSNSNPSLVNTREKLAIELLQLGRVNEAVVEFSRFAGADSSAATLVAYAKSLLLQISRLDVSGRDWSEFDRVLSLLSSKSMSDQVSVLRAERSLADQRFDDAEDVLNSYLEENGPNPRGNVTSALAEVLIRQNKLDQASAVCERAVAAGTDSPELRLKRAVLLTKRETSYVDEIVDLARVPQTWDANTRIDLAVRLAKLLFLLEKYDGARNILETSIETEAGQNDLTINLLMMEVGYITGDHQFLARISDRLFQSNGESPLWMISEALLSLLKGKEDSDETLKRDSLDKAIDVLSKASLLRPRWKLISRLRGEIYTELGEDRTATTNYVQAIKLGDRDPAIATKTLAALVSQRRFIEAEQVLRLLKSERVESYLNVSQVATEVSVGLQEYDRAIRFAALKAEESDRFEDWLQLGRIYAIVDDSVAAREAFRRAVRSEPNRVDGWLALVQLLRLSDRKDALGDLAEEAKAKIDDDHVDLVLAICYRASNDPEKASTHFELALERNGNDPAVLREYSDFLLELGQGQRAVAFLEKMIAGLPESLPEDRVWARRRLALVLAQERSGGSFSDAKELIAANRADVGEQREDQRVLAAVLELEGTEESLLESVKILERITSGQGPYSDDSLSLAKLYRRLEFEESYRSITNDLLAGEAAVDLSFLASHCDFLIRNREFAAASDILARIRKQDAEWSIVATLESRLLFTSASYTKLLEVLEQLYSSGQREKVVWAAEAARRYATSLANDAGSKADSRKLFDASQRWLEANSSADPVAAALLTRLHIERGDFDAAAESLKTLTVEALATLCQVAISSEPWDERLVDGLLDRATELDAERGLKTGDAYRTIADFASRYGKWKKGARLYQNALELNPDSVPSLNNLAVLLAVTKNDLELALESIDEALKLARQEASAIDELLDTRGVVFLALGDSTKAESDFREALRSRSTVGRQIHLAMALNQQERNGEAAVVLKRAVENGIPPNSLHPLEFAELRSMARELGFSEFLSRESSP